jgi:hypothetical protein
MAEESRTTRNVFTKRQIFFYSSICAAMFAKKPKYIFYTHKELAHAHK